MTFIKTRLKIEVQLDDLKYFRVKLSWKKKKQ